MKQVFTAVMLVFAVCSCAFGGDVRASSMMDFNDSVIHDEAGVEWTPSGDPVLSSVQSLSGGKSLYLDGNSYLQAKNTQPFDLPREFTLEAWICPKEWVTDGYGGATFTVFSRWLHGVRTLYLVNIDRVDDSTGTLSFYTDFAGMTSIVSKAPVPLNKWTHVAVTRDSEKVVRVFVNGHLEAEGRLTQDFTSTDYPMTIGASSNAMRKSVGYIDDWHVYKSCLWTKDFVPGGRVSSGAEGLSSDIAGEGACRCRCGYSAADEVRKFKGLLDDGIITQEEFDAVKKKLLGL